MQQFIKLFILFGLLGGTIVFAQDPVTDIWDTTPILFNADQQWTSTNVSVGVGDTIQTHVEGYASAAYVSATDNRYWFGPEGWTGVIAPSGLGWPLEGYPMCVVMGKIGESGIPFVVGKYRLFISNAEGVLYLGYNDNNPSDNFGTFVSYITKRGLVTTGVINASNLIDGYALHQNYPNPFNPSTTIEYQITQRGNVELGIYDINGRLVKTLLNTEQYPGNYTIRWDGKNDEGLSVSSGSYFYQVKSDNVQLVKKMLFLK